MAEPAGALVRRARAKVNLNLHITGRRADGYHTLSSLIAFADVADTVTVAPASALHLEITGPFASALGDAADNLVLRAARGLAELGGVRAGARITLDKHLPVAAGIGGGSADAAATLDALAALWAPRADPAALDRLALDLGADVPICRHGRAALVGGIGEVMAPVPPLPPTWLVLVNPGVAVSTGAVFQRRAGPDSPPLSPWPTAPADAAALADALAATRNDLEPSATALAPDIATALTALAATTGCRLRRMSGSGATCFGVYDDEETARTAAERIVTSAPTWWVRAAPLVG
jgi:4-diphosphocytidyl-2-C-methyl-D-erythritol kinase